MSSRKRAAVRQPQSIPRRSKRSHQSGQNGNIPDVYNDMLAEVATNPAEYDYEPSPKRRKVELIEPQDITLDRDLFGDEPEGPVSPQRATKPAQVVFDDFGESNESEVEFEDVDLEGDVEVDNDYQSDREPLQLDLSKPIATTPSRSVRRRKPVSAAERKSRLDVHKAHLLLLLAALYNRNRWSESEVVHAVLKPLVSRKIISLLHVDESQPQYQRSHSFNKGIEELCMMWKTEWNVSARGMRRAFWRDGVDVLAESEDAEDFVDFDDFVQAAKLRKGSRDLGAQLFAALLRSVAVDARLVCSLQVLPFSAVAKGQTPEKSKPKYVYAPEQNYESSSPGGARISSKKSRKKIADSPYPIYWVEVLSPATATWIPLDPLVRHTINKPKTGFEPPASDHLNAMTYVVAFEDDGSIRDVTRRYSQWYNAKTRKTRVESTKGGEQWWRKTLNFFSKDHIPEVRDELEEVEFARRAETEGMPKNVQDFKGHPVYVLERHLRANEVIHPRREVGKVAAGVGKNSELETVFRRQDVHLCRSADAWYRRGRDVRTGEAPLKRAAPKRREQRPTQLDEDDPDAPEEIALYAEFQTDIYEPPPAIGGRIPRNAFGNLDVYVPSMIPAGTIHIRHPLAGRAAQILGTDYVEAVTGFEFKGRQGTAVVDGAVMSSSMRIAMITVIIGLQSMAAEESQAERSRIILGIWKRWLMALRIRAKVEKEYGGAEQEDEGSLPSKSNFTAPHNGGNDDEDDEDEYIDDAESDEDDGGGFMPEAMERPTESEEVLRSEPKFPSLQVLPSELPPQPVYREIIIVDSPHELPVLNHDDSSNVFDGKDVDEPGGFIAENSPETFHGRNQPVISRSGGSVPPENEVQDAAGGGFMLEDDDYTMSGGFVANDEDQDNYQSGGEGGGGFMVDDENDTDEVITNNHHAAQARPSQQHKLNNAADEIGEILAIGDVQDLSGSDKAQEHASGALPTLLQSAESERSQASPSSSTSLLSHDPAEDDADPEWLVDVLD